MQCTLLPTRAPATTFSRALQHILSSRSILGQTCSTAQRSSKMFPGSRIKITPLNYPISHPAIYVFARCITTRRETSLVLSFNHPRDYQLSYHPLPPVRINEHELTHSLSNVETTLPVTLSAAVQDRKQSGRILMDYTCRHRLLRVRGPLISPIIVYVRRINTVFY